MALIRFVVTCLFVVSFFLQNFAWIETWMLRILSTEYPTLHHIKTAVAPK